MKAMVLHKVTSLEVNKKPLELVDFPVPIPKKMEVLLKISACGVCHTELDEIEGRTPPPFFPIILGHQAIGRITGIGEGSTRFQLGQRVGVAWIYSACGKCRFCLNGYENLCEDFVATGRDVHGGYAEYMTAREDHIFPIPESFTDAEAAPLLCAGAVGYRSLKLTKLKDGQNLGLYGFGASAHLVLKMVRHLFPGSRVFVNARRKEECLFARERGAFWTGSQEVLPAKMDAIIDTTPAWEPVLNALANLEKGGRLVINAIRKENADKVILRNLSYQEHMWLEKEIKTVANVTGKDVGEFLKLAEDIDIKPQVLEFPLTEANAALVELKEKKIKGAKILRMEGSRN